MHFIQENKAYSDLTIGVFAFIIIQCVFIAVLFGKASQTQQLAYKRELTKEQLKNLKMYTDQLEKDHLHLREFEHSYKDGIATLRSVAGDGDYTAMKQALEKLEVYSNGYFDNISMQLFKDLNNVQNSYLKSLFISKLTLIHQDNIKCHFECRNVIEDIDINIFDLVRLLGISIDNAIEATKGQNGAQIQIAIVKEKQQLSFLINNTIHSETKIQTMMQEGFTTKKNHSGLGMVNVQDIKKKYPNLFVQYRKNNDWFNLNITLLDLGGAEYVNH
ncbi:signal transduction protein [Companilactobacillus kimchii DSM 13961 = JCM 10707]|nr:signal transduction protein [Companilactobacillus kimchii DSM 13961 = JCM 10707]